MSEKTDTRATIRHLRIEVNALLFRIPPLKRAFITGLVDDVFLVMNGLVDRIEALERRQQPQTYNATREPHA